MKTKRFIVAIALLVGGVLFTVDALNTSYDAEDTAIDRSKLTAAKKKLQWG